MPMTEKVPRYLFSSLPAAVIFLWILSENPYGFNFENPATLPGSGDKWLRADGSLLVVDQLAFWVAYLQS